MSRLYPVSFGTSVLLVPDPIEPHPDRRVVKPTRVKKEYRRARI